MDVSCETAGDQAVGRRGAAGRRACPVCGWTQFEPLIDFGRVPVSGQFLETAGSPVRWTSMVFEFCGGCATVRRRTEPGFEADYARVDRSTGGWRAEERVGRIVRRLEAFGVRREDLVVDVGANDGVFLDRLAGFGYGRLVGVEPSRRCAELIAAKGYWCEAVHFDEAAAEGIVSTYGRAAAVTCRHVLEHVACPGRFVRALRRLVGDGGVLLVEVPDAVSIVEDLQAHGLWDEHLWYFFAGSLVRLLERNGWSVAGLERRMFRDAKVLECWARPAVGAGPTQASRGVEGCLEACRCFSSRWERFVSRMQEQANDWPRPVVAVGASHPQSNYLVYTGLGRVVDRLVDDDALKVGCYVPIPQAVPVVGSEGLDGQTCSGTILRTAFGYAGWMDRLCGMFRRAGGRVVEPYAEAAGCGPRECGVSRIGVEPVEGAGR